MKKICSVIKVWLMYAHKITIYQNGKNERSHLKAENEETHKRTYDLSQKKVVTLQR